MLPQQNKNNLFIQSLLSIAMLISLIVWSVFGLIIYIPMILRMTSYYCGMVLMSAFSFIDLNVVRQRLEYAIHVYPDTFTKIVESFKNSSPQQYPLENIQPISWEDLLKNAAVDIVWTIIFWSSSAVLFIKYM